jgi:hypothetical protein
MASKTTLNAKNLETLGAARLAPIYDVSTVLSLPHVVKTYALSIGGKKARPDSIAGRHWEALAPEVGCRPTDVKSHVEYIDTSSGALGNAVARTLEELLPIVIDAPADEKKPCKMARAAA